MKLNSNKRVYFFTAISLTFIFALCLILESKESIRLITEETIVKLKHRAKRRNLEVKYEYVFQDPDLIRFNNMRNQWLVWMTNRLFNIIKKLTCPAESTQINLLAGQIHQLIMMNIICLPYPAGITYQLLFRN